MSVHQCGRSLKLAVSRFYTTNRYHSRILTDIKLAHGNSDNIKCQIRLSHTVAIDSDGSTRNLIELSSEKIQTIALDDITFVQTAKSANFRSEIRPRDHSENSLLKPNSYEILSTLSRKHAKGQAKELVIPSPWYHNRYYASEKPAGISPNTTTERNLVTTRARQKLFDTIDVGVVSGPKDWPATFYRLLASETQEALNPKTRASLLSYLVKRFVFVNRLEDIIRLHVEIHNSWLPHQQRQTDSITYLKALLKNLTGKPTSNQQIAAQVLEAYRVTSEKFDAPLAVRYGISSAKYATIPELMLFLSNNLPIQNSLAALAAQAKDLRDANVGTQLIPQIYANLNRCLIKAKKLGSEGVKTGKELYTFYNEQSSIFSTLGQIPCTEAVGFELAKKILEQALTLDEILEAKRITMDSGSPDRILDLQYQLLSALYRISLSIQPYSIKSRHVLEFFTDFLSITNFRGPKNGVAACISIGGMLYARFSAFTALEKLLATGIWEVQRRSLSISTEHIRKALSELSKALEARGTYKRGKANKSISAISNQLFTLHISSIYRNGHLLDQRLLRDVLSLLGQCNNPVAIRDIWGTLRLKMPVELLKKSTIEAFITALTQNGDVLFAKQVLDDVQTRGQNVITASTLQPFLPNKPSSSSARLRQNAGFPLDEVVKLGIYSGISWQSLAHIHMIRQKRSTEQDQEQESNRELWDRNMRLWGDVIQDCVAEVKEEHRNGILEMTLARVEHAFSS